MAPDCVFASSTARPTSLTNAGFFQQGIQRALWQGLQEEGPGHGECTMLLKSHVYIMCVWKVASAQPLALVIDWLIATGGGADCTSLFFPAY